MHWGYCSLLDFWNSGMQCPVVSHLPTSPRLNIYYFALALRRLLDAGSRSQLREVVCIGRHVWVGDEAILHHVFKEVLGRWRTQWNPRLHLAGREKVLLVKIQSLPAAEVAIPQVIKPATFNFIKKELSSLIWVRLLHSSVDMKTSFKSSTSTQLWLSFLSFHISEVAMWNIPT